MQGTQKANCDQSNAPFPNVFASTNSIKAFDTTRPTEWPRWVTLLKFNFTAMRSQEAELKRAHFFTLCGDELYNLACNILHPRDVSDVHYDDIIQALSDHFRPQVNEVAAYYRFHHCVQKSGQRISEFVAELRKLASDCGFGATLDNMIRNQLVCGMRDGAVRTRLLQKADLTLQCAIEMASRAETALQHIQEMTAGVGPSYQICQLSRTKTPTQAKYEGANSVAEIQGQSKDIQISSKSIECYRCSGDHLASQCHMDPDSLICTVCKKIGHVAKVCRSSQRQPKKWKNKKKCQHELTGNLPSNSFSAHRSSAAQQGSSTCQVAATHQVTAIQPSSVSSIPANDYVASNYMPSVGLGIFHLKGNVGYPNASQDNVIVPPAITIQLEVDGITLLMEVDSGAAVSVIHKNTFFRLWGPNCILSPLQDFILDDYHYRKVRILGTKQVNVLYRKRSAVLPLIVVDGCKDHCLLGRNWFQALGFTLQGINSVQGSTLAAESRLNSQVLHPAFASDDSSLGEFKGPPIKLDLDTSISPKYLRSRPVPYAIHGQVIDELERLQVAGVLEPIPYSTWATPVVIVPKRDGSIRMCGDYKATVNKVLKPDRYPLPTLDALFVKLSGGTIFSKLDLDQAFTQLRVDEEASRILTINTIKGLFAVHRLPFGISAAPGIFQRLMEGLLAGIDGVAVLIDDIVISGRTKVEHDQRLTLVLDVLYKHGLKIKKSKCMLFSSSVEFLGFRVDKEGIHPLQEKLDAITNAPTPKNKVEMQALLGVINFYDRFIPERASIFEPLYRLLDKDAKWCWTQDQEDALNEVKKLLTSDRVLTHYDGVRPLMLSCDASPYGVAAVLSHVNEDGTERPIGFKSRTLSETERNYSQTDREALSFIFGVMKFHKYIFGRSNVLFVTDHKPLLGIFKQGSVTPEHLSPRMLRWALILSAYDYQFVYREGRKHGNADAFSRLPLPCNPYDEFLDPAGIHLLEVRHGPVTWSEVADATASDSVLNQVRLQVVQGWSNNPSSELKPFWNIRDEISVQQDCLLRGDRVIVPISLRQKVLDAIHSAHHGVVRTKMVARSYVWWPGLSADVEKIVKLCQVCQENRDNPPKVAPQPWPAATRSWERVHFDYAGPINGQVFLLAVDAFSRFPVIKMVNSMSAPVLVQVCRDIFSDFGVPSVIISDNGSQFKSQEFNDFLIRNGVRLLNSPPFHPSSNGIIKRMVRSFKNLWYKHQDEKDQTARLARVVFAMRTGISIATQQAPADLFYANLKVRSPLDMIRPVPEKLFQENEIPPERSFAIGDTVRFRDYRKSEPRWSEGTIIVKHGSRLYSVLDKGNQVHTRSVNQLISRSVVESSTSSNIGSHHPSCNIGTLQDYVEDHIHVPVLKPDAGVPAADPVKVPDPISEVVVPAGIRQGRCSIDKSLNINSRNKRICKKRVIFDPS